jgi:hypothetical protein
MNPPNVQVPQNQIGQTVQVSINVTDVTNLWRWWVSIQWNPQVLNLTSISEGPFLKSVGATLFTSAIDNQTAIKNGLLPEAFCGLESATGATGSGVLANVNFTALAPGASSISLKVLGLSAYQNGSLVEIPNQVINGNFVVVPEIQGWLFLIAPLAATAALIILKKKQLLRR